MTKIFVGVGIAIVVLGAVTQLVIPGFAERHVEAQLEEDSEGGEAVVDLSAFPAVRLLFGGGDRFEARGRGLRVDLTDEPDDPLGDLDKFDEVDIDLEDLAAGPADVQAFSLYKGEGDEQYSLHMEAETTPAAIAESVGGQLGGQIGQLIAGAGAASLPGGGAADLPIDMDATVTREDDGRIVVDADDSTTVSGVPIGPFVPFAEAMVASVIASL